MRGFSNCSIFVLLLAGIFGVASGEQGPPGSDIQQTEARKLIKVGPKGGKLYTVNSGNSVYTDAVYIIDLAAGSSSYDQGFDSGFLLGDMYLENYNNLMISLLGNEWWEPAVAKLINVFLDWQYNDYLGVQVPDDFANELTGMSAGGHAARHPNDIGVIAKRGITLANFPGTLTNIKYILMDEKNHPAALRNELSTTPLTPDQITALLGKMEKNYAGFTCSMFGVWGSRTEGGKVYTGRNLDWIKDSGISKYKLVSIHRPVNGYAHATFGWAGIWGAITGMSSQGITVHEANLESDDITFRGFPWVLRLRYVMANAKNIEEATALWQATNSTVGFNHGFGSAQDRRAIVLETMAGNSAIFGANDPREQDLVVNDQQIGQPRDDAVYRTNHGYDAYTIAHYLWNGTNAYQNSIDRYLMFPSILDSYQAEQKTITYVEAVNVTALVGHKGDQPVMYECTAPYNDGSNILSVSYDPAELIAYAAWENGSGSDGWAPAACNTYLAIDFKKWF